MNAEIESFFENAGSWQQEVELLRSIVLDTGLTEHLKWGCPCYTCQDDNVVLIHTFKTYCALLFFKGALLNDTHGILVQQSANVQAQRQIRFKDALEVTQNGHAIRQYIFDAINLEKAGLKVNLKKTSEFAVAEEFQNKLNDYPALKGAFGSLTPGRQRAYLLHFSKPSQSKTREARIQKCIPQILNGIGLND